MQTDLLAGFPGNWHYSLASNEEKDRFHAIIGRLIAAEIVQGLEATNQLMQIIRAARAQQCLAWLDKVREDFSSLIRADEWLSKHDEAEIVRAVEKTTAAAEKTQAAYTKAAEAHSVATRAKNEAAAHHEQFCEAQAKTQTGDQIVQTAWEALKELRAQKS